MTLGLMTDQELVTFNRIRKIVALRTEGSGITLAQLGDVGALARELGQETPVPKRVEVLAERLGLDVEEIEGGTT